MKIDAWRRRSNQATCCLYVEGGEDEVEGGVHVYIYMHTHIYIRSFYIPYSRCSGGDFLQSQLSVLYGYISPVTNPEAHINPLSSPILLMDLFTPPGIPHDDIRRVRYVGTQLDMRNRIVNFRLEPAPGSCLRSAQQCGWLKQLAAPVASLLTMSVLVLNVQVRSVVTELAATLVI